MSGYIMDRCLTHLEIIMGSSIASRICYLVGGTLGKSSSGPQNVNKSTKSGNGSNLNPTGRNIGRLLMSSKQISKN